MSNKKKIILVSILSAIIFLSGGYIFMDDFFKSYLDVLHASFSFISY